MWVPFLVLGGCNKAAEKSPHLFAASKHTFRMPLNSNGKRMRRMLDGFYRLIRGKSADFQINSRPVDRLMVKAVDFCLFTDEVGEVNRAAKTGKESGGPFNPDRMADITAGVRSLHMIKRFSGLIADILKYGSLAGSIENLHSTADGKYRFCRRQNQLHQADLKQIQCDIGVSDAFSGFLAK